MCLRLGSWRYLIPLIALGRTTKSFINTNKNKILQLIIFLIHGVELKTYIKNMPGARQDGDEKCVELHNLPLAITDSQISFSSLQRKGVRKE